MIVVTQWMVKSHGQGRINLEIARFLANSGRAVHVVSATLDDDLRSHERIVWHRVPLAGRLPVNWLREQFFCVAAGRVLRRLVDRFGTPAPRVITNGAAVDAPSTLNLAMFVHAAWHASADHPRHRGTARGRYHGLYNRVNATAERTAFAGADRVVALSPTVADELIQHDGVPADRITVVAPGVDVDEFHPRPPGDPGELRALCGLPTGGDGPMLATFVGEIRSNRKNLDLVLRAVARTPGVHLTVFGSTDGSPYPEMARSLGCGDRTHWLGHREDVASLLPGGDVFAFPSRYEPYGLVITEAMACGLPAIVTPQCGAAMFVNNDNGLVLDGPDDLDGVAERLRFWSDHPVARRRAGTAARAAVATWDWTAMGRRYAELLDQPADR